MNNDYPAIQTLQPPLEDLALIETHKSRLHHEGVEWNSVGIFTDKENGSTLILLLQDKAIHAVLRFVLSNEHEKEGIHSQEAIALLLPKGGIVYLRNYQGNNFSESDVRKFIFSSWSR